MLVEKVSSHLVLNCQMSGFNHSDFNRDFCSHANLATHLSIKSFLYDLEDLKDCKYAYSSVRKRKPVHGISEKRLSLDLNLSKSGKMAIVQRPQRTIALIPMFWDFHEV
jgi:hypothetical protein